MSMHHHWKDCVRATIDRMEMPLHHDVHHFLLIAIASLALNVNGGLVGVTARSQVKMSIERHFVIDKIYVSSEADWVSGAWYA